MAVLTAAAPPRRGAARHLLAGYGWKMAVLAALAVWLLVVGAHHEPWADESQAWLISRDSSLVSLFTENVRYEGTPGLWHLVLWLAIRCGLPFGGLYLISLGCALAGAALLVWRAPFPAPLRALLAFSYFGAYQFAVVARSYALDLVLLPALADLFARRTERPVVYGLLVGLLANCNAHSFMLAVILGAEWAWTLLRAGRAPTGWTGLALAALLGLGALLTAWQPADNGFLHPGSRPPALGMALRFVGEAFIDRLAVWHVPSLVEQLQGIGLSLLVLAPALLLASRAKLLALFVALIAVLIGFSAFTYSSPWHSGILFLVWIFGLWIAWPAMAVSAPLRPAVLASLAIVATVQAAEAAQTGWWDIHHPYSGGARGAELLKGWRADHPQARIAVAGFKAFEMQPYFPSNIFANYQGGAPRPSYIVWKRGEPWHPFETLSEARKALKIGYDALLLSTFMVTPSQLAQFEQSAEARGYRIAMVYPGGLEWKGYIREDNTLLLFVRDDEGPAQP